MQKLLFDPLRNAPLNPSNFEFPIAYFGARAGTSVSSNYLCYSGGERGGGFVSFGRWFDRSSIGDKDIKNIKLGILGLSLIHISEPTRPY